MERKDHLSVRLVTRTTRLYDRRHPKITRNTVARIAL